MDSLRVTYEDRRTSWRARAAAAGRAVGVSGWAQVATSVGVAAVLVFASQAGLQVGFVLLAATALAATHAADRVFTSRRRRAERSAAFYDAGLDV